MINRELQRREDALRKQRPEYMKQIKVFEETEFAPLLDVLFAYKRGDSAEKAIYTLAQCQTLMYDTFKAMRVIRQFEQAEVSLHALKASLPQE